MSPACQGPIPARRRLRENGRHQVSAPRPRTDADWPVACRDVFQKEASVTEQPTHISGTQLPPGERAPEFTLPATPDQRLSLAEMSGRPVILAFYPADWSPVCGDEMSLFNEVLPEFHKYGAQLVGISTDGVWCHAAFAAERKLHFPLLADFEPKGEVARRYGVYRAADGIAERALFVIDAEGIIRWSYVSALGINPGADGILEALESLSVPSSAEGAAS
ncbi:peroxiredoxin [Rhizobiales bacterium Sp-1]|uniref:Peroxiredoxin n=1 Tax=Segnochrobactrum spirostomi TaxID=2608987 RepID=A0A6A7YBJ5_9HYPH|nr:peroxiredoxin [Segnochrobactrum spirostomi]